VTRSDEREDIVAGSRNSGPPLGFKFTETMGGYISPGAHDFRAAEYLGRKQGNRLRFTLTVTVDDLRAFIADPAHRAQLTGTVEADRFGGVRPVEPGTFHLFMQDENGRKQMRYAFRFRDVEGRTYRFEGFKDVHNDYVLDFWKDTTTLFVTVWRDAPGGYPGQGQVAATGVLHIRPVDLVPQVLSMRAVNASGPGAHAAAVTQFGLFFLERMLDEYLPFPLPPTIRRRLTPSG
jgi:cholesterol oxidase